MLSKDAFLTSTGLGVGAAIPLAGDASTRRYTRIYCQDASYILMEDSGENSTVKAFTEVAHFLAKQDISVPQVYYQDLARGLLLLEDFGDITINKLLRDDSRSEHWYHLIIKLLVYLRQVVLPDFLLQREDQWLIARLKLFTRWYWRLQTGDEMPVTLEQRFIATWQNICTALSPRQPALVLGDFHADNLMYLSQRTGKRAIGILDFQDAYLGRAVGDLVSLLDDVRIQLPQAQRFSFLTFYAQETAQEVAQVTTDYEILAAIDNLRIIGFCARASLRDGITRYLKFIPRAMQLLTEHLANPLLSSIKEFIPTKYYS